MIDNRASKMIIVTSGGFTSEAIAFAQEKRLWLVNGSELVHMIEDGRSFMNKPVIAEPTPDPHSKVCPNCQSSLVTPVAKKMVVMRVKVSMVALRILSVATLATVECE